MAAAPNLSNSHKLLERARARVPAASQTLSKGPTQFVQGVAPVFLARGQGSHVWDVDGNEFIDYPMGLGPVILGHNYAAVNEAVVAQLAKGVSFSLPTSGEVELAEVLADIIPCAEMTRLGKNGSDVTSAAIRAARACTGREKIAQAGYHGWADWHVGATTRNKGVPRSTQALTLSFKYNDLASLERLLDENRGEVAAVILEPMGIDVPEKGFLQGVRELATQHGAVLIFDEIVTGFRLGLGGAQGYFGVTPDLAAFGKAMGNGFPISAIVGRKEVMKEFEEVFFSMTFGGEAVSIAAALATIQEMRTQPVFETIWKRGGLLAEGTRRLIEKHRLGDALALRGLAPRTYIETKATGEYTALDVKSLVQQEALLRGILFSGNHMMCYSHSEDDVQKTLAAYDAAFSELRSALDRRDLEQRLRGTKVQPVFRQP